MHEKLKLAQELARCLCGIDISVFTLEGETVARFIRQDTYLTVLPFLSESDILNNLRGLEPGCVYILTYPPGFHCIVLLMPDLRHYLFAGPCLSRELSENEMRRQLHALRLDSGALRSIVSYCSCQPVISPDRLYRLGHLLARHVLGIPEPVSCQQLEYRRSGPEQIRLTVPDRYEDQSRIRQVERRYEASNAAIEAIKQGNLSLAYRFIHEMSPDMTPVARNVNPLRNIQNFCIILNTQLRHAMEELHLHPYQLDRFSTEIAIRIENLRTTEEAANYCMEIIRKYCELSQERAYAHLNHLTRQAVVYIKTHLSDNLSVKDTAKALVTHPNYLSGVFRREMGITFIDFVNRERCRQAAGLLRCTNMPVQLIASSVGYNNTSYFARQFTRFYDMTPRSYRDAGEMTRNL